MRVAINLVLILAAFSNPDEQPANNVAMPIEVEALPADESAATTSDELANGVNEPDAGEFGNAY